MELFFFSEEIKDEKESDHFRAEIERGMMKLDGPELLHFAMIFVKGALEKSQVCQCSKGAREVDSYLSVSRPS